jgi:hypothetical protein
MTLTFKRYLINETSRISTKFPVHKQLNSKIWDNGKLRPDVKKVLEKIAKEFEEFLESPQIDVKDISFTGSLANYNYTRYSDIDLHLIVSVGSDDDGDCKINLKEFFATKKNLWNQSHDITVCGFPVELYAQLYDEEVMAEGIYSVTNNKWTKEPTKTNVEYDEYAVKIKAHYFTEIIDRAIADSVNDKEYLQKIMDKIITMRKSGLEKGGEFSEENLAFKSLRNAGYLKKLNDYRREVKNVDLSLD